MDLKILPLTDHVDLMLMVNNNGDEFKWSPVTETEKRGIQYVKLKKPQELREEVEDIWKVNVKVKKGEIRGGQLQKLEEPTSQVNVQA